MEAQLQPSGMKKAEWAPLRLVGGKKKKKRKTLTQLLMSDIAHQQLAEKAICLGKTGTEFIWFEIDYYRLTDAGILGDSDRKNGERNLKGIVDNTLAAMTLAQCRRAIVGWGGDRFGGCFCGPLRDLNFLLELIDMDIEGYLMVLKERGEAERVEKLFASYGKGWIFGLGWVRYSPKRTGVEMIRRASAKAGEKCGRPPHLGREREE